MDILIFSGQSNMQGQTESLPLARFVENAYEYRLQSHKIIPLAHPVGENLGEILWGAYEGKGSIVPDFCTSYIEKLKTPVLAVHAARGGTTIREWLPTTERYNILVKKCKSAILAALHKYEVEKIYFIWLQGESDAIENTSKQLYKDRMEEFRENLVKDLEIDGFFIIRVGKFVRDDRDINIISAQEELCKTDNFVMLTRITGLLTESKRFINPFAKGHYNNTATSIIGKIAGENLALFRQGEQIILEEEPYSELRK